MKSITTKRKKTLPSDGPQSSLEVRLEAKVQTLSLEFVTIEDALMAF